MTCGLCGSGVSADEKFKKLKDGTVSRYVYYGCTRARDLNCKSGYIREKELIDQLIRIVDKIDINEIGMRHKFEEEVERFSKFQKNFLKGNLPEASKDINLRTYAKYLLKEGSTIEKRELLSCMKSRLVLAKKVVRLDTGGD